jgi:hypothetical protein
MLSGKTRSRRATVNRWRLRLGVGGLSSALTGVLVPNMGGSASATAGTLRGGGSSPAVQLVREYLTALGPASSAIQRAERTLRGLPATATVAQVEGAMAGVRGSLSRVEALLTASARPTTLEALGTPAKVGCYGGGGYRTVTQGAHLDVDGKLYDSKSGFQVTTECSAYSILTWPLDEAYGEFSARFGDDALNHGRAVTLSFRDSATPIPFVYGKTLVFTADIPVGRLIQVTVTSPTNRN